MDPLTVALEKLRDVVMNRRDQRFRMYLDARREYMTSLDVTEVLRFDAKTRMDEAYGAYEGLNAVVDDIALAITDVHRTEAAKRWGAVA